MAPQLSSDAVLLLLMGKHGHLTTDLQVLNTAAETGDLAMHTFPGEKPIEGTNIVKGSDPYKCSLRVEPLDMYLRLTHIMHRRTTWRTRTAHILEDEICT